MRTIFRTCAVLFAAFAFAGDNNLPRAVEDKIIKNANFANQSIQKLKGHSDDLGDFKGVVDRETANIAEALDAVAGDIDTLPGLINQTNDPKLKSLLQQKLQQMYRSQGALVGAVNADKNLAKELGECLASLSSTTSSFEEFRECMLKLLDPDRKPKVGNSSINISAPGKGKPPTEMPPTTSTDPATRIDQNVALLDAAGKAIDNKAKWVNQFANEFPQLVADVGAIQAAVEAEYAELGGDASDPSEPGLKAKKDCLKELRAPLADLASAANEVSAAETADQGALKNAHDELHGAKSVMEHLAEQARS